MNKKAWSKDGEKYYPISTSNFQEKLNAGVYVIKIPPMSPMYFDRLKDDFSFSYKIYGHNTDLVNRVSKTFNNTTENLGVLLNGYKGTGKSVTAELICNKISKENNMPVILVNERLENLPEIVANIHQDVIIFIDEFEKIFTTDNGDYNIDNSQEILTIMDGALKSEHRRLFVFTTNNTHINDNLLQRPGRIRYLVQFKDLSKNLIEEIVDDMLEHREHRESTVEFIAGLKMITVDIVKAIIHEVNLFNEAPQSFKHIFNVEEKGVAYNVYKGDVRDKELLPKPLYEAASIAPNPEIMLAGLSKYVRRSFHINDVYLGEIVEIEDNVITINSVKSKKEIFTLEPVKAYHSQYSMVF
jgi:SpoVK/Ycf46/Vps4 family AAA+-type ATPase